MGGDILEGREGEWIQDEDIDVSERVFAGCLDGRANEAVVVLEEHMSCTEYLLVDFRRHARRLEGWREVCERLAAHIKDVGVKHTANDEAILKKETETPISEGTV
jgi:uncharacterized protein YggU (UPF0235/DUF167 family)